MSDKMCTVRCNRIKDTNNLVVMVTWTNNTEITIAKYWKKYLELGGSKEYWREYANFEDIKNRYNNSVAKYEYLKDQQRDNKLPRNLIKKELEKAENDREKALERIKKFQKKHPRYPTKEEYNEWVEAFGEEIKAQLNR